MIYRILCEGMENNPFFLDIWEKSDQPGVRRRRLMGAYAAGAVGWGTSPRPHIGNRRARFYFTERGWHKIGRTVLMDARRRGIVVRVVRLRNPPCLRQSIEMSGRWRFSRRDGEEKVVRRNDPAIAGTIRR